MSNNKSRKMSEACQLDKVCEADVKESPRQRLEPTLNSGSLAHAEKASSTYLNSSFQDIIDFSKHPSSLAISDLVMHEEGIQENMKEQSSGQAVGNIRGADMNSSKFDFTNSNVHQTLLEESVKGKSTENAKELDHDDSNLSSESTIINVFGINLDKHDDVQRTVPEQRDDPKTISTLVDADEYGLLKSPLSNPTTKVTETDEGDELINSVNNFALIEEAETVKDKTPIEFQSMDILPNNKDQTCCLELPSQIELSSIDDLATLTLGSSKLLPDTEQSTCNLMHPRLSEKFLELDEEELKLHEVISNDKDHIFHLGSPLKTEIEQHDQPIYTLNENTTNLNNPTGIDNKESPVGDKLIENETDVNSPTGIDKKESPVGDKIIENEINVNSPTGIEKKESPVGDKIIENVINVNSLTGIEKKESAVGDKLNENETNVNNLTEIEKNESPVSVKINENETNVSSPTGIEKKESAVGDKLNENETNVNNLTEIEKNESSRMGHTAANNCAIHISETSVPNSNVNIEHTISCHRLLLFVANETPDCKEIDSSCPDTDKTHLSENNELEKVSRGAGKRIRFAIDTIDATAIPNNQAELFPEENNETSVGIPLLKIKKSTEKGALNNQAVQLFHDVIIQFSKTVKKELQVLGEMQIAGSSSRPNTKKVTYKSLSSNRITQMSDIREMSTRKRTKFCQELLSTLQQELASENSRQLRLAHAATSSTRSSVFASGSSVFIVRKENSDTHVRRNSKQGLKSIYRLNSQHTNKLKRNTKSGNASSNREEKVQELKHTLERKFVAKILRERLEAVDRITKLMESSGLWEDLDIINCLQALKNQPIHSQLRSIQHF